MTVRRHPFDGDATGPIDQASELPAARRSHWADALSVKAVIDRRWQEVSE